MTLPLLPVWRMRKRREQDGATEPHQHPSILYTIGHSTHPIEIFMTLLSQHRIGLLADVRSFPGSRRWPQFNQDELKGSLRHAAIEYRWFRALGGRRHSRANDSPHTAWQHRAFRSYADHADTAEFAAALEELLEVAANNTTAIMCSEGLWWQCHRRIIADHVSALGWQIRHIMPNGRIAPHALPEFARIHDGRIIYDGGQGRML